MSQIPLPSAFKTQLQTRLGDDYPAFAAALDTSAPTSIRLHKMKKESIALPAAPDGAVPWHPRAHYLAERPSFTLDPNFHAGAYYVQEAASMLVAFAFNQLRHHLGNQNLRVLDMCAAPGGKTTAILDELGDEDFLVANEVIQNRAGILRYNLTKWGYANVAVTNHDPQDFAGLEGFFDCIVVDAPCSGEGLFRRDPAARLEWTPEAVGHCNLRQQRILQQTLPLLRPGGLLLYSTCTYNGVENEQQVAQLVADGYRHLPLAIPTEWNIETRNLGYQCYPHRTRSEGFYLAALQKTEGTVYSPSRTSRFRKLMALTKKENRALAARLPEMPDYFQTPDGLIRYLPGVHLANWLALDAILRRQTFGTGVGVLKRDQLIPDAALALSLDLPTSFAEMKITKAAALKFLRGEVIELPDAEPGWVRVCYGELGLGWAKKLPRRVNNYYPKGWRIRMKRH